jgi:hypothetical protein
VIRSGPDGSVILQTKAGFEAANCGPLNDSLVYDGVPPGLSAKPTLSVETDAPQAARVTLTLSYLAWGFDWQADYVLHMQPGGRRASILAWVTLASSDPVSFPDAQAAVVGGKVNREDEPPFDRPGNASALQFHCYLQPFDPNKRYAAMGYVEGGGDGGDIIVTAQRRSESLQDIPVAMTAIEEGLGDLKLYRLPIATTIASNAQKQVAMFVRPSVKVAVYYQASIQPDYNASVRQMMRMRNRRSDGLGLALPAGQVAVFEAHRGRPVLTGSGVLVDSAMQQDVEVELGEATQLKLVQQEIANGDNWSRQLATISNANPFPVDFEGWLSPSDDDKRVEHSSDNLEKRHGVLVWKVRVPANGAARLRYDLRDVE